jgi:hypothetical protein
MDSRILHVGSQGPQVGYFTQGKPRNDFSDRIREHAPWSVRWIESSPTDDVTPTYSRFVLPGKGAVLHAAYLVMNLSGNEIYPPVGPNLIQEVVFRANGTIIDRIDGEWIGIDHDSVRTNDEHIGRDILEYNVSGGTVSFPIAGTTTDTPVIVDLPFFFRGGLSRGLPIHQLIEDRHEFLIYTRQQVRSFSMIFEVSDLPKQEIGYMMSPGVWSLDIMTRNRMIIDFEEREKMPVILPFTEELAGIVFGIRPVYEEISGNYLRFNGLSQERQDADLDETSLTPLYRSYTGELLKEAELVIGNMLLERREAMWWREHSWRLSGRTPPDRTPFIYGRFWDITPAYPSGGTFLDHLPRTELRLTLRPGSPNSRLILWGLTRNTVSIKDRVVVLDSPI